MISNEVTQLLIDRLDIELRKSKNLSVKDKEQYVELTIQCIIDDMDRISDKIIKLIHAGYY